VPNRPGDATFELQQAASALTLVAADDDGPPALDDGSTGSGPRAAAERWFLECVERAARARGSAYQTPADALLSLRRDIRLTLELARMPSRTRERLLATATERALDILFAKSTAD
jgi:hypothetical protein